MKISARNQFESEVVSIKEGAVNAVVSLSLGEDKITSSITMEAVQDLGLEAGKKAYAVIKASNVMVAKADSPLTGLSARNQLCGTLTLVKEGAVNGHVSIKLAGGQVVSSSITNEAIEELGLKEGDKALAIIKSTDVMVAVD